MCLQPIRIPQDDGSVKIAPCGKCNACVLRARAEWAHRLREEWRASDYAFFVTLTYDNEHLPIQEFVDLDTGCIVYVPSVYKRDVQLFLKRLRKRLPVGSLRYYLISEYGSEYQTMRPHYHAMMFLNTTESFSIEDFYQLVKETWNNGIEITVDQCTDYRINYVTTYCYDHFINPPEPSEPNFRLVSKGAHYKDGRKTFGIGYQFVEKNLEFIRSGKKFQIFDNGHVNLSRYYREKIYTQEEREEHREQVEYEMSKKTPMTLQQRRNYIYRTNKVIFKKKNRYNG